MIKVKDVAIKNSLCHRRGVVCLKIERDKVMKKNIVGKGGNCKRVISNLSYTFDEALMIIICKRLGVTYKQTLGEHELHNYAPITGFKPNP